MKKIFIFLLSLLLCISMAGCQQQGADNQLPNAPWGASIDEVAEHYDLTYVEYTEEELSEPHLGEVLQQSRKYHAEKKMFGYDVKLRFTFLCPENEASEYNSYLYSATVFVSHISKKDGLAIKNGKDGNLWQKFGGRSVEESDTLTAEQLANFHHNQEVFPWLSYSVQSSLYYLPYQLDPYLDSYDLTINSRAYGIFTDIRMEIPE